MKWHLQNILLIIFASGLVNSMFADSSVKSWLPGFIRSRFYSAPKVFMPRVVVIDFNDSTDLIKLESTIINTIKNPNIHGVLLIVEHRGGSAPDISVIHDLLLKLKRLKPIVVLIKGFAFSGGYWVASTADYIIAHRASEVGSIGIFMEIHRWKNTEFTEDRYKSNVQIQVFKAGKYKAITNACSDDLSEDEKKYLQQNLEAQYQVFKNTVAENRNLDLSISDDWAEGKIFIASKALELKLIDEIGTRFEAENKLIKLIQHQYPDCKMSDSIEFCAY